MIKLVRPVLVIYFLVVLTACRQNQVSQTDNLQVAFLADVHLQNVYGQLQDSEYKGVLNLGNGKYVLARTMEAQLHSTRLFNENYFAFLAALDDIASRGVKYVVLPGDFSDDGQPLNVQGLKEIMKDYSSKYGMAFLVTTGNHDPVRPFTMEAGKTDFLGKNGKPQAIMSKEGMFKPGNEDENPAIITRDIRKMGYEEIISELSDFGFFPKKSDLYWENPFSTYNYDNYSFQKAKEEAGLNTRNYPIPPYNTTIPDVSYLVEPVSGLWFLAIDANVYIPKEQAVTAPSDPLSYGWASVGYNQVLSHKKHLIDWVEKVSREAEKRGKTLIAFSHYPMVDFNDDATPEIRKLIGNGKMDLYRVPAEEVARTFAKAGIKLHFGGHMHINDTGIRKYADGSFLVNVQTPSLAAYIPAYKLLTIRKNNLMEVETITLDSVPRFRELFPLYRQEYARLDSIKKPGIWDKKILSAPNYHDYTSWHLKELVKLRYLQGDWPNGFRDFLLHSTGKDLLEFVSARNNDSLKIDNVTLSELENWTGFDLVYDFYRLRSADKLAVKDIGENRLAQYKLIMEQVLTTKVGSTPDSMLIKLKSFAVIFDHFLNGAPADHFTIDTKLGTISPN